MTGADSKNEKRAACSRPKPNKRPAVIVTPDLEVPGTNASA